MAVTWIEQVGKRTRNGKTRVDSLNPRRFALDATIGSIHYEDNGWQEIDNIFEPAAAPWDWQMLKAGYHIRVKDDFTSGQILEFEKQGETVQLQPMALEWTNDLDQIQPVAMPHSVVPVITNPEVDLLPAVGVPSHQGTIRWNGGYGKGLDFQWRCAPTRLAKILQIESLDKLPVPAQYIQDGGNPVLRLNLIFDPSSGVDILVDGEVWDKSSKKQTFQTIEFIKDGETLWGFMPLRYWDSGDNEGQSIATLERKGQSLYISIRVPYDWLQTAVYPVYIDVDIDEQVGLGVNDGVCYPDYPAFINDESAAYGGWNDGFYQADNWALFTGISNLSGTIIGVAYLELYGANADIGTPLLEIFANDAETPTYPTDAADYSSKVTTTASVNWDDPNLATDGWTESPSIVSVIQELADSYDPDVIMIISQGDRGSDGYNQHIMDSRQYEYAGNAHGWKLHIEYTAPAAPTVTTQAVDDIASTTATLNGTVTDDGGETIDYYGFVWDDDSDEGDPGDVDPSTPAGDWENGWKSGSGNYGENPFDHGLTGLTQGTTYYVRAAAHNVNGWSYGPAVSFRALKYTTVTTSPGLTASTIIAYKAEWDRAMSPGLTVAATIAKVYGRLISTTAGLTVSATVARKVAWVRALTPGLTISATVAKAWGRTEILRPNAAGDECNIGGERGAACPNHYQNVDEVEADDEGTKNYSNNATYERDLYNLPASSGTGAITKITLYFRVMSTVTGNCVKGAIKSGDTVAETAEKSPFDDFGASTWDTYSQEWATNPDDSEAWEWSDIDDLQIGIALKTPDAGANYGQATQVYVEVDYNSTINFPIVISTALTAAVTIARALAYNRATTPGLTVAVSIVKSLGRLITTNTALAISTTISKVKDSLLTVNANLTASATVAKTVAYNRATTVGLTISATVAKSTAYKRAVSAGLTVATSIIATFSGIKNYLITVVANLTASATVARVWGRTVAFRPNADIAIYLTPFPNTGEDNYEDVDEVEHDGEDTLVYRDENTYAYDKYGIPDHTTEFGVINKVTVHVVCAATSADIGAKAKAIIETLPETHKGDEESLTTDFVDYSHEWSLNPYTTAAWTWDKIDNLRIGVDLNGGTESALCTQVYVEVNYKPAINFPIAISTALTAAVSIARTLAYNRATTPGLTVAVSIVKSLGRLITTNTALAISTTISKVKDRLVTVNANLTASATVAKTVAYNRASTVGLTISATVARTLAYARAMTSNLTAAVTITKRRARTITTSTALAVSTSISKAVTFARALTPGLTASATVDRKVAYNRATSPGLTAAVTVARTIAKTIAVTASLAISVAVSISATGHQLFVKVITSQYRKINIVTAQYRIIKVITAFYRKVKSITTGG